MSATQRHRFDDLLAHLLRQQGEVFGRKRVELRVPVNGIEYSCHEFSLLQGWQGRYMLLFVPNVCPGALLLMKNNALYCRTFYKGTGCGPYRRRLSIDL